MSSISFNLKYLPLEELKSLFGYLNGLHISKLLLCGDKRISYLILNGGAVDSLVFHFPSTHPRPYFPSFVYLMPHLKALHIYADKRKVIGLDIKQLPRTVEILVLSFERAPHAFWRYPNSPKLIKLHKILPNLRELSISADTYCCNPAKKIFQLPPSITRLHLLKLDPKYLHALPSNLVELEVAFTSYRWEQQMGKLPISLEKLILHNVKHSRFMSFIPPNLRILQIHWNVYLGSTAIFDENMLETAGWNFLPPNLESFETSTQSMTAQRVKCLPRTLKHLVIAEEWKQSRAMDWIPFLPPRLTRLECPISMRVEEIVTRTISGSREDAAQAKEEAIEIILRALPRRLRELPHAIGALSVADHLDYLSAELEVLNTSDMSEKGLLKAFSRFPLKQVTCRGVMDIDLSEIALPKYMERLVFNLAISRPLRWNQNCLTALSLTQITDSIVLNALPITLKVLSIGVREIHTDVNLAYLKQLLQISIRFLDKDASAPLIDFLHVLPKSLQNLQLLYAGENPLPGSILAEMEYLENLTTLHVASVCALMDEHLTQLPPNLNHLVLKGQNHQLTRKFFDVLPISLTKISMPPPLLSIQTKQFNRFRNLRQLVMEASCPTVARLAVKRSEVEPCHHKDHSQEENEV